MQHTTRSHLFLVWLLAIAAPLKGQESAKNSDSAGDLAREIAALKQSIERLEAKVDALAERPSEFSRVSVRIVDEQGEAQSGFKLELISIGDVQRATASGVSKDDGAALTRHMPYGAYRMHVSGNGWRARGAITVEVGQQLDLTVVAPSSNQLSELVLDAALAREAAVGLPFGGWKVKDKDDSGTYVAPEPGMTDDDASQWKTFPTVSDGIEVVAVAVNLSIERRTQQADGNRLTWQWRGDAASEEPPFLRWLVQSDGTVRPLLSAAENQTSIDKQAERFEALVPDESEEHESERSSRTTRLGFHHLKLGDEQEGQALIELPAGQVKLQVSAIFGRPSQDVLQAINEPAETAAGELWLPAVVLRESKWREKLLGPGFANEINLAAGQKHTITVGTTKF